MSDALIKIDAEADSMSQELATLQVTDAESFQVAALALREVASTRAQIEAERKRVAGPAYETWKKINDFFGRVDSKYEAFATDLKKKIAAFDAAQKEVERKQLQEAALASDHNALMAIAPIPVAQGVTVKQLLDYEIVDEAKLPREFLEPNLKLIRATVMATKGNREIPGVRIFRKASVAATAAR